MAINFVRLKAANVAGSGKGIFLLGATTLEALGLILDPIRRELKPLPMLLMAPPASTPRA